MSDEVLLRAQGLSFAYAPRAGGIVSSWDASFAAGSLTALTGPSGRGKSTVLYLLGLMLQPSGGEILVGTHATSGLRDSAKARLRAAAYGFVFQDAALDASRSVIDNVTESALYRGGPRRAARTRARELLERFDVAVPPSRRPGQVSGGQAQRIALCRALIGAPRILLADEPTGNLDPATAQLVVDALRSHAATGAAVIVVTHSPEVASACDRVLEL